jgi:Flp pilus assembly pilin Flp
MSAIAAFFDKFWLGRESEKAQSTVEYVLIATFLAIFGYGAVRAFSSALGGYYNKVKNFRTGAAGMAP